MNDTNVAPDATPDKLVFTSKKRDASSPLQEPSLELKKSKLVRSPLGFVKEAEVEVDMASNSGETVLTEQDLNNIAKKMQDIFLPAVKKMIDSSVKELKNEYDNKLDVHNQRIDNLSDENDELRSEISTLRLEVERLKSRDDELEQYSRRNSIRIAGVKESDKRPTSEILLDIAHKNGIEVNASDIDRSHRVGEQKDSSHRSLLVKFTSYRAKKLFMKKKKELAGGLYFNEDLTKTRGELLYQARQRRKNDKLNGAWSYDGRVYIKDILNGTREVKSELEIDTAIFEVEKKIADDPDKYRAILEDRKSKSKPGSKTYGTATGFMATNTTATAMD